MGCIKIVYGESGISLKAKDVELDMLGKSKVFVFEVLSEKPIISIHLRGPADLSHGLGVNGDSQLVPIGCPGVDCGQQEQREGELGPKGGSHQDMLL